MFQILEVLEQRLRNKISNDIIKTFFLSLLGQFRVSLAHYWIFIEQKNKVRNELYKFEHS